MIKKIIGYLSIVAIFADIWIASYFIDLFEYPDWRRVPTFMTGMILFFVFVISAIVHLDTVEKRVTWTGPR